MSTDAAAFALTIASFSLPARTVAGAWECDDFHGGACAIEVLPGGTCSMRYESEHGARRGVYDLSGFGTCSVRGDAIEFSWERAAPNGRVRHRETPLVSRAAATLNRGSKSFIWDGFTLEMLDNRQL